MNPVNEETTCRPERIANVKDVFYRIAMNLNELDFKETAVLEFLTGQRPDDNSTSEQKSFIGNMEDVEKQCERLTGKIDCIIKLLGVDI